MNEIHELNEKKKAAKILEDNLEEIYAEIDKLQAQVDALYKDAEIEISNLLEIINKHRGEKDPLDKIEAELKELCQMTMSK